MCIRDRATRGFAKAIDVWGADHHGHVARMKGAMDAIGLNGNDLDVVLMQMVNLMRDGQPVRMSKRTEMCIRDRRSSRYPGWCTASQRQRMPCPRERG